MRIELIAWIIAFLFSGCGLSIILTIRARKKRRLESRIARRTKELRIIWQAQKKLRQTSQPESSREIKIIVPTAEEVHEAVVEYLAEVILRNGLRTRTTDIENLRKLIKEGIFETAKEMAQMLPSGTVIKHEYRAATLDGFGPHKLKYPPEKRLLRISQAFRLLLTSPLPLWYRCTILKELVTTFLKKVW